MKVLDIFDFDGKDIIFKTFFSPRVKNLVVIQNTYLYYPSIGMDLKMWFFSKTLFQFRSFQSVLYNYLIGHKIPITSVSIDANGESGIVIANINIKIANTEEINALQ